MRHAVMWFVALLLLAFSASEVAARPRISRSRRFESNKTFGIGLELGEPTGLTGKYFLRDNGDQAIQFGVGELGHYLDDRSGLNIYADYLWHPIVLASAEAFELPLFIGVGARFWDFSYGPNDGYAIGVRVPFGITFDFNNVPLDIYLQLVPILDFIHNYTSGVLGDFDATIGARFWFE
jgi:hypothetical protein